VKSSKKTDDRLYLYGLHAVRAALANPRRKINNLLIALPSEHAYRRILEEDLAENPLPPHVSETTRGHLESLVGKAAVHQDIVAFVKPLPNEDVRTCLGAGEGPLPPVALLDQVTDPHNIGAVLRSAAAFGLGAVITAARHSPGESGLIGRVSSGGLDVVPWLRVRNLGQACETLLDMGYELTGFAREATEILRPATFSSGQPQALLLGSEGEGLREKTRGLCTRLVHLPTRPPIQDLNVSNAAAIAFYALGQSQSA